MVGTSVSSWLVVTALTGVRTGLVILLGMMAPLAVAVATWVMTERTHRRDPERVTRLMIEAFAAKLLFFGGYVAVMLKGLSLPPVAFIASFTAYFITLHFMEALFLKRLFTTPGSV